MYFLGRIRKLDLRSQIDPVDSSLSQEKLTLQKGILCYDNVVRSWDLKESLPALYKRKIVAVFSRNGFTNIRQ